MQLIFTTDIDECVNETDNCNDELSSCNNTEGSFVCTCNSGYSGDGVFCESMQIQF